MWVIFTHGIAHDTLLDFLWGAYRDLSEAHSYRREHGAVPALNRLWRRDRTGGDDAHGVVR